MVPPGARLELNASVLAVIPLQARHLREVLLRLLCVHVTSCDLLIGRLVDGEGLLLLYPMLAIRAICLHCPHETWLVEATGQIDGIVGGVDVVYRRGKVYQTRRIVLHHL